MFGPRIHPTAIVHPNARLAPDVTVGAYSIIGEHVEIGEGTQIGPHVVIHGYTRIGAHNKIFQFCSLGEVPQDKKYQDEPTRLEIGDYNTIREFCTFNTGTIQDAGVTRVGNRNWIMAYVHIAHDCQVGDHTIFANNAQLAGHVHIDDYAILGGFTVVHQFCHIGKHSLTGMGSIVFKDILPFVTAAGNTAKPHGINTEGLRRHGFTPERIEQIKDAYKIIYRSGLTLKEAITTLENNALSQSTDISLILDFLHGATRGIIR